MEKSVPSIIVVLLVLFGLCCGQVEQDRLKQFYDRIKQSDAMYCADRTKLMPSCTECIPGLRKAEGSQVCSEFIPDSRQIRDEIKKLTDERYGDKPVADRPFGLYPCMLSLNFMFMSLCNYL